MQSITDYEEIEDDADWLLIRIIEVNGGVNHSKNKHCTLYRALTALVNIKQKLQTSNAQYYDVFCVAEDHLKVVGGKLMIWSEQLIAHVTGMTAVSIEGKKDDEEHFLAVIFSCISTLIGATV